MNINIQAFTRLTRNFPAVMAFGGWLISTTVLNAQTSPVTAPAIVSFNSWLVQFTNTAPTFASTKTVANGIALAKLRRMEFAALIKTNPAQALSLGISKNARRQLPPEVVAELETPLSGLGDYVVQGAIEAKGGPKVEAIRQFVHLNGQSYRVHAYGRRLGQTTKHGIPLRGVVLDGVMALDERALRELEAGETPDESKIVVDIRTPAEKALNAAAVDTELGGQVYRFASHEAVMQAEARLEAAEAGIGPAPKKTAAEALHASASTQAEMGTQSPSVPQPNPPTPWTTNLKKVLIIRIDFSDLPGNPVFWANTNVVYTQAYVQNFANTYLTPYYEQSSYGLTSLSNTVSTAVYRMPRSASYYAANGDAGLLHADAESAASVDYNLANFDRIVVLFSSLGAIPNSQINFGGLADIGGPNVWVNGEFNFRVLAHELGHTFGLYHADLWKVNDGNPISPNGVDTDYGDDFDTMGANYADSSNTDFNPWFKNTLGWAADNQVLTVTSNGTYRVNRFDNSTGTGTLALKVVKDGTENYWISCRRKYTASSSMMNGAYIFWGYNYNRPSDLLDLTTPGNNTQDAALAIGGILDDSNALVTIHPIAQGGTAPNEYIDVQIIFGVAPPLSPSITQQPANETVVLGATGPFLIAASGNPAPSFQWQRKAAGGSNWNNLVAGGIYSIVASNLTVNAIDVTQSGDQFQCIVSNASGSVTSAPPATLTIKSGLKISTLAGSAGVPGDDDGTGPIANFYYPWGVATDKGGTIYVADYGYGSLRKITPAGVVTKLAPDYSFYGPEGVAIDAATNIYVLDTGDEIIAKVSLSGAISTVAGQYGVSGTADGTNTSAQFNDPGGIAVDNQTNIFVCDSGSHTIRKISRDQSGTKWVVKTIAGLAGAMGVADGTNSDARFNNPTGIAVDSSHNIYVADSANNTIRKITADVTGTNWVVTTFAGMNIDFGSQDGTGTSALFYNPQGLAVDAGGNIFVADQYNNLIRKITPAGVVTTLAGIVSSGSDNGFYTGAQFFNPKGVAVDGNGNIYVTDTFNYTLRVGHMASVVTPTLKLTPAGAQVTLSWLQATTDFTLQSNTNLATGTWTTSPAVPLFVNGRAFVTNAVLPGKMFYRMLQQ